MSSIPRSRFSAVFGPKPRSDDERAVVDGLGQTVHRGDSEVGVEDHRFLRAEPGDRGQRPHAGRDLRPQLLDRLNLTGLEVLDHLLRDGLADVRNLLQAGEVEFRHVRVVSGYRAGRSLVHPGLERLTASDREKVGVLLEQRSDHLIGPGHRRSLRTPYVPVWLRPDSGQTPGACAEMSMDGMLSQTGAVPAGRSLLSVRRPRVDEYGVNDESARW